MSPQERRAWALLAASFILPNHSESYITALAGRLEKFIAHADAGMPMESPAEAAKRQLTGP